MIRFGALLSSALIASALSAQAAVFTDRASFEAANPGLATVDFEGVAPVDSYDTIPADTYPGINLVVAGGFPEDVMVADSGFIFGNPTDALFSNVFDLPLVITFDNSSAAGFNVALGYDGGFATIEVFDGATLLDSQAFVTVSPTIFTDFIGFSYESNSITEIRITPSSRFVMIDNLSFGNPRQIIDTPAPAAGLLFAGGLLVLGWTRRRR